MNAAQPVFTFTSAGDVYQLIEGAEKNDISDQLSARLDQLQAMLMMTRGEGGEAFRRLSDHVQDSYMWGVSMMLDECKELAAQL
jgi:hypothetical protein